MNFLVSVYDNEYDEEDDDDEYETDEDKIEELFGLVASLNQSLISIFERLDRLENGS